MLDVEKESWWNMRINFHKQKATLKKITKFKEFVHNIATVTFPGYKTNNIFIKNLGKISVILRNKIENSFKIQNDKLKTQITTSVRINNYFSVNNFIKYLILIISRLNGTDLIINNVSKVTIVLDNNPKKEEKIKIDTNILANPMLDFKLNEKIAINNFVKQQLFVSVRPPQETVIIKNEKAYSEAWYMIRLKQMTGTLNSYDHRSLNAISRQKAV